MIHLLVLMLLAGVASGQTAEPQNLQSSDVRTPAQSQPLQANEIMARVAANQARAEILRNEYTYKQHIHIATHKPNTRMMRQEDADYEVIPQREGVEKRLKLLTGRYWKKDKYVDFRDSTQSVLTRADADLISNLRNFEPMPNSEKNDADVIRYLRNYLLADNAPDGSARSLFPLTFEQQKKYNFHLLGLEVESGRNVYHIAFSPKNKQELTWTGEAFIDAEEFEPVRVFTKMARPIPPLVRTMWFDLPGLGFNVVYQRQAEGVWFPAIFGTEFRLHTGAVFYFNRDIAIALENSGFEHSPPVSQ